MSGSEGEEAKEDNDAKDDGISSSASSVGENDATDGELSSSDAETGHKKKDKKKHKHKKKKKHKEKDKEKSKRKRTHSRFVFYILRNKTREKWSGGQYFGSKKNWKNAEFTPSVYSTDLTCLRGWYKILLVYFYSRIFVD